jgi:predicted DNA-binding protein YlxM (UPF0122 family)
MNISLTRHPSNAALPPLTAEEFHDLEQDILTHGILQPVTIKDGQIIDGYHRYLIASQHNLPIPTTESDKDPQALVLSHNLYRRHLTAGQKAALALAFSEEHKLSLSEAAEQTGIDRHAIAEIKEIKQYNPEAYEQVQDGTLPLYAASQQTKNQILQQARQEVRKTTGMADPKQVKREIAAVKKQTQTLVKSASKILADITNFYEAVRQTLNNTAEICCAAADTETQTLCAEMESQITQIQSTFHHDLLKQVPEHLYPMRTVTQEELDAAAFTQTIPTNPDWDEELRFSFASAIHISIRDEQLHKQYHKDIPEQYITEYRLRFGVPECTAKWDPTVLRFLSQKKAKDMYLLKTEGKPMPSYPLDEFLLPSEHKEKLDIEDIVGTPDQIPTKAQLELLEPHPDIEDTAAARKKYDDEMNVIHSKVMEAAIPQTPKTDSSYTTLTKEVITEALSGYIPSTEQAPCDRRNGRLYPEAIALREYDEELDFCKTYFKAWIVVQSLRAYGKCVLPSAQTNNVDMLLFWDYIKDSVRDGVREASFIPCKNRPDYITLDYKGPYVGENQRLNTYEFSMTPLKEPIGLPQFPEVFPQPKNPQVVVPLVRKLLTGLNIDGTLPPTQRGIEALYDKVCKGPLNPYYRLPDMPEEEFAWSDVFPRPWKRDIKNLVFPQLHLWSPDEIEYATPPTEQMDIEWDKTIVVGNPSAIKCPIIATPQTRIRNHWHVITTVDPKTEATLGDRRLIPIWELMQKALDDWTGCIITRAVINPKNPSEIVVPCHIPLTPFTYYRCR